MALIDNLTSYWKLDESSGDAADSHGTTVGVNTSATFTGTTPFINNHAVFNGSSSRFTFGTDYVSGSKVYSISAWIYTAGGAYGDIFGKDGTASNQFVLRISSSNNLEVVKSNVGPFSTSTSTVPTNQWSHIVLTQSATAWTFYINGSAAGTAVAKFSYVACNNGLGYQRNNSNNPTEFFSGSIDEVGVWSRELSSAEVTELYNGGIGLAYPFSKKRITGASTITGISTLTL